MNDKLLEIDNLSVHFHIPEGVARAVDGVSVNLTAGETIGLVGESGCGKSVTSLSILGLIPSPPGKIESGKIRFNGQNLLDFDSESLRQIRGRDISMIFQEPMTSLNPVLPVWLDHVKIPAAAKRLNDYPHQLSGGMRQRVMIAMAMVCGPKLLIADEPTTALDVTIQAQILSLMTGLKEELEMSLLLITHDLGVVAQMASRVVVMYAGQVVEEAMVAEVFDHPFHPYTQGLLKSIPQTARTGEQIKRLIEIQGTVPPLTKMIVGCKFADRCPHNFNLCREKRPSLFRIAAGHRARCWLQKHPERRRDNV
jgi:oligopeptide/dipeptide ABC transporter ATP-binding protein